MSDHLHKNRLALQKAILEFFYDSTKLPVGFYEVDGDELELVLPESSTSNYEAHCTYLHSIPGAKALCDEDQCRRTRNALSEPGETLSLCHAGLWNAAAPIVVEGTARGTVLFGEILLEDEEAIRQSLEHHKALAERLNLTSEQTEILREKLLKSKRLSREEVSIFRERFKQFEKWLYALFSEEDRVKQAIENVSHEVFIRLQALVAEAENLATRASGLTPVDITERAVRILAASQALGTVVATLGDFLEDYRFRSQPIAAMLEEAKATYAPEAERRGIEIRLDLQEESIYAEVSRSHLQMALNNLMQNAIKYSFTTVPTGRTRSVDVKCRVDQFGENLFITFTNYGVGILPEELSAIFQPGFKGRLTHGEYRHGAGLGMSVVHDVVERHGGRVSVESKQMSIDVTPEGQPHLNRFRVILPLRRRRSV